MSVSTGNRKKRYRPGDGPGLTSRSRGSTGVADACGVYTSAWPNGGRTASCDVTAMGGAGRRKERTRVCSAAAQNCSAFSATPTAPGSATRRLRRCSLRRCSANFPGQAAPVPPAKEVLTTRGQGASQTRPSPEETDPPAAPLSPPGSQSRELELERAGTRPIVGGSERNDRGPPGEQRRGGRSPAEAPHARAPEPEWQALGLCGLRTHRPPPPSLPL